MGDGKQEVGQAGPAGGLEPEERLLELDPDGAAQRLAQAGIVVQAPHQAAQRAERAAFGMRVHGRWAEGGHDGLRTGPQALSLPLILRVRHKPENSQGPATWFCPTSGAETLDEPQSARNMDRPG